MSIRLSDLLDCFEGVIPSIVATADADGVPNVSYLSHVVMVDDEHVGLSNQFFSKTASNLVANPQAEILIVNPRTGGQFALTAHYHQSLESGPIFEHVAAQLQASSEQIGMADVMRLKAVTVLRVTEIVEIPSASAAVADEPSGSIRLAAAARVAERIAEQAEAGDVVAAALDGLVEELKCPAALLLLHDASRGVLTTIASRGYPHSGAGSEVPLGQGVIGAAATQSRIVKINDMSRVERFGAAIETSANEERRTRTISLPRLPGAMSQIAAPMRAHGVLLGVLFAESGERLAFRRDDEQAISIIARQTAAFLALAERLAFEGHLGAAASSAPSVSERAFRVTHHAFDDSVFIDHEYIIKGVAGRLLMFVLDLHVREGRSEFTNREIRLSEALRLPDVKDNLETRLLLLRQRLEDKRTPIRLERVGRGRFRLRMEGFPLIEVGA